MLKRQPFQNTLKEGAMEPDLDKPKALIQEKVGRVVFKAISRGGL